MIKEQIDLFGEVVTRTKRTPKIDKDKRNWEDRFQRWSDKKFKDGRYVFGDCCYGSMCDYCEDDSYGRPCVRALNKMLREKQITLDYKTITFEEVWNGEFKRKTNNEHN